MENVNLNKMCEEIIDDKFKNGDIEKILENCISKGLEDVIKDMFNSYHSPLQKQLEEKLQPVLSKAIADSSVEGLIDKLKIIIDNAVKNKEIADIITINEELNKVTGLPKYNYKDKVSLSTIFEEYKKFVQENISPNYDIDKSELEFYDGSADVQVNVELSNLSEDYNYYGSSFDKSTKYVLTAKPENDEEFDSDLKLDIKFSISYDNYLSIDLNDITLKDICNLPKFILWLYNIQRQWVKIAIDEIYFKDEITISVEEYDE